ncbi:hypothetical protein T03_14695, partial [Trichinella britovi]
LKRMFDYRSMSDSCVCMRFKCSYCDYCMDNKNCSSLNVSLLSNRWTALICECLFAWVIILLTRFF